MILVSISSYSQTGEAFYKKANEYYDKKDFKNALVQVDKALASDSINLDYLLTRGNSLFQLKEYQNSFTAFSKAIYYYPASAIALNQRGILLYAIQEFEYSIQDYTAALALPKNDSLKLSLYINRGGSKLGLRNFQGAYDDFMRAYKINSFRGGNHKCNMNFMRDAFFH